MDDAHIFRPGEIALDFVCWIRLAPRGGSPASPLVASSSWFSIADTGDHSAFASWRSLPNTTTNFGPSPSGWPR